MPQPRSVIIPPGPSIAYLPLTQGLYALIDRDDAAQVERWNWCVIRPSGLPRPMRRENRRAVLLYRKLLNAPAESLVDHRNGNTLDNRRANLRLCTSAQNLRNTTPVGSGKSGRRGVSWDGYTGKWRAWLMLDGKLVASSRHKRFEDAVAARERAEREHFGEFRRGAA